MRWLLCLVLVACGAEEEPADTDAGRSFPADSSAEGIADYVASGVWQAEPWVSETDGPRERANEVSPHDRVRVWFNDVLVASRADGNGDYQGTAHVTGSMAIKELADETDAVVGHAAMLKLDGDAREWAYYCDGPEDRCGITTATSQPYWGIATDAECGFCHGGLVFTEP